MFDFLQPPAFIAEQTQERPPIASDTITECAAAYEARYAVTNDPKQGALALLERLRDDLDGSPLIAPAKQRERLSRRRQKQLRRALDLIIETGRSAA